jgi:hypothetical protein
LSHFILNGLLPIGLDLRKQSYYSKVKVNTAKLILQSYYCKLITVLYFEEMLLIIYRIRYLSNKFTALDFSQYRHYIYCYYPHSNKEGKDQLINNIIHYFFLYYTHIFAILFVLKLFYNIISLLCMTSVIIIRVLLH